MARTTFNLGYSQDSTGVGKITFSTGSNSFTVDASGRLDRVGDQVFSPVIPAAVPATPDFNALDVTIECTRTSSQAMRVLVSFNEELVGSYTNASLERVLEDVPLSFTP